MTLFLSVLIVSALVLSAVFREPETDREPWRLGFAALGLIVAISSRQLVWTTVGFEICALALAPVRRRSIAGSAAALVGLVLIASSGGSTDLAFLPFGAATLVGLCLFEAGLVSKWLEWRSDPAIFAATGVAVVSLFVRVSAWAPTHAEALSGGLGVVAIATIVGSGLVAAFTRDGYRLSRTLVVFGVALAVLGTLGGPLARPHLLIHLAVSTLAVAAWRPGVSRWTAWVLLLTLASIPPLPGFVSKFFLLAHLPLPGMVAALAGTCLLALGCARALPSVPDDGAGEKGSRGARWLAAGIAVLLTTAFGLLPSAAYDVAARAATSLF